MSKMFDSSALVDLSSFIVPYGSCSLADIDPHYEFSFGKKEGKERLALLQEELEDQQKRLYGTWKIVDRDTPGAVFTFYGPDGAGKGKSLNFFLKNFDVHGFRVESFGVPTEEERAHHYSWRIKRLLPQPGEVVGYDRGILEDIVAV
jgi:polyphosphate kinase 2 (PPK2 family)